jgi:hypothetical protein
MSLNSSDIEDTFVQTNQDGGAPSLEGASDGSGSIFSNLFDTAAQFGSGYAQKYLDANKATARAANTPVVQQAQDTSRYTLWAIVGAIALVVILFVVKRGK